MNLQDFVEPFSRGLCVSASDPSNRTVQGVQHPQAGGSEAQMEQCFRILTLQAPSSFAARSECQLVCLVFCIGPLSVIGITAAGQASVHSFPYPLSHLFIRVCVCVCVCVCTRACACVRASAHPCMLVEVRDNWWERFSPPWWLQGLGSLQKA